ncbi:MAG: hypothetical protein AAGA25_01470 [Planctomycetota bacterium]
MKTAVEHAISEATTMALEDLRQIRERFTDETENNERMKHANASIRLVQCLTRSWGTEAPAEQEEASSPA